MPTAATSAIAISGPTPSTFANRQKTLSDETITTVVERTGGVPLFVEELTRAVLDRGTAKPTARDIPVTLHDSLMARLDRLGPAKEVLQIGAIIGSDFSYELLQAPLEGLPEPAVAKMIELLSGHEPSPALVDLIYSNTDGNPLFGTALAPNVQCNIDLILSTASAHSFNFVAPSVGGGDHHLVVSWSFLCDNGSGTLTAAACSKSFSNNSAAACAGPGSVTVTQVKAFNQSGGIVIQ